MTLFLFLQKWMTDLCLRELTEILIYCGRRCLAPLNKSHKIQQNEIERIRGIVLKTSTRVISIITHVLNPLVISHKKYIYWKYFMRFIRVWLTSSIISLKRQQSFSPLKNQNMLIDFCVGPTMTPKIYFLLVKTEKSAESFSIRILH